MPIGGLHEILLELVRTDIRHGLVGHVGRDIVGQLLDGQSFLFVLLDQLLNLRFFEVEVDIVEFDLQKLVLVLLHLGEEQLLLHVVLALGQGDVHLVRCLKKQTFHVELPVTLVGRIQPVGNAIQRTIGEHGCDIEEHSFSLHGVDLENAIDWMSIEPIGQRSNLVQDQDRLFIWMCVETLEDFFVELETIPLVGNIVNDAN